MSQDEDNVTPGGKPKGEQQRKRQTQGRKPDEQTHVVSFRLSRAASARKESSVRQAFPEGLLPILESQLEGGGKGSESQSPALGRLVSSGAAGTVRGLH